MTSEKRIKLRKRIALISIIIATIIFGSYYLTDNMNLLFIGSAFIFIAGIVNLINIILIINEARTEPENRRKLFITGAFMSIIIPVFIFYFWFSMILLGQMRITFTNPTEHTITNINIIGCETEHISELKPNESKTVWVGITGDCSISVEYLTNGNRNKEIVVGYTTPGMGQKMNHEIDGKDGFIL